MAINDTIQGIESHKDYNVQAAAIETRPFQQTATGKITIGALVALIGINALTGCTYPSQNGYTPEPVPSPALGWSGPNDWAAEHCQDAGGYIWNKNDANETYCVDPLINPPTPEQLRDFYLVKLPKWDRKLEDRAVAVASTVSDRGLGVDVSVESFTEQALERYLGHNVGYCAVHWGEPELVDQTGRIIGSANKGDAFAGYEDKSRAQVVVFGQWTGSGIRRFPKDQKLSFTQMQNAYGYNMTCSARK